VHADDAGRGERREIVPAALALVAVVLSALVGGNAFGLRERAFGSESPQARPVALSRAASQAGPAPTVQTVLRSQPWWQAVRTYDGAGPTTTTPFSIDATAINWRVRWSCRQDRLDVVTAGAGKPLLSAACPGSGTAYGSRRGQLQLAVAATGPWHLQVDQQVDVPLVERPLPGMTAATEVSHGALYRVDQTGSGTVRVYRLPGGRYALRLESFFVTANSDLDVQLTPLALPRTTKQIQAGKRVHVSPLDITAGSVNLVLPPGLNPQRYRSVVIWCERLSSAYAAATLARS